MSSKLKKNVFKIQNTSKKIAIGIPKSTLQVRSQNICLGYGRGAGLQKTSVIVVSNL